MIGDDGQRLDRRPRQVRVSIVSLLKSQEWLAVRRSADARLTPRIA